MSLTVPPAKNYTSPLASVPTVWDSTPVEGNRMIVCEIDWGTMGGTNNCVNINLQNNSYANFSQIVALAVDNSQSGADIQFIFPDTAETTTVPAYTPKTIVPVFTNMTQFYVSAPNASTEDISRFSIHNSLPPPVSIPTTQEQNVAAVNSIGISTSGSQAVVASSINGTMEALYIQHALNADAAGANVVWTLKDGTGKTVAVGTDVVGYASGTEQTSVGESFTLSGINVRFNQGLVFSWTSNQILGGSFYSVNAYYRTP